MGTKKVSIYKVSDWHHLVRGDVSERCSHGASRLILQVAERQIICALSSGNTNRCFFFLCERENNLLGFILFQLSVSGASTKGNYEQSMLFTIISQIILYSFIKILTPFSCNLTTVCVLP